MRVTPEQAKFRELYGKTCNVTTACEALGRPRQWGYNQLKRPYMADLAAKAFRPEYDPTEVKALTIKSPEDIRKIWEDIITGVRKCSRTIRDKEGNEFTVEEEYPPAVIVKVTEMYARVFGMFVDRVEVKSEHTERRVLVCVPAPRALPSGSVKALPENVEDAEIVDEDP